MFTVERQDTVAPRTGFWANPLFHLISSLGQTPRSFALRVKRRTDWFAHGLTARKALNTMAAVGAFTAKREHVHSWPVFVVVDITPMCNLHCTVCLHAHADENPDLERQHFAPSQRMSVDQYARLIDEIKDHTLGVLLYYLGDPIVHPQLPEICRVTHAAGLNSHVSTNFSVRFTEQRLEELIASGLTHLTVCVDGLAQETYQRTRVGGRLDRVVGNLKRAIAIRNRRRQRFPRIEIQYIKYQHNLDELAAAHRFFRSLGVDQVHEMWGWLHNYTDRDPGKYDVFRPRRAGALPWCHWPHLFTVVKYDGAVLPCCAFRLGSQYTDRDNPRHLGNVFDAGFHEVWTSPPYRAVRRFACDPMLVEHEPELVGNFCYACPRLFETNYTERTCRFANEHTFEQLYEIGPDTRPHRRPETIPARVPGKTVPARTGRGPPREHDVAEE